MPKKPMGTPAITADLRDFIEAEFSKYGYVDTTGRRSISLAPNVRLIAAHFNVSEGTVKNAFVALRVQGYIVAQHPNLYFILASADSQSSKGSEDTEEDDGREIDAEERRLPLDDVIHIVRDIIINCGFESADKFIDAHRSWCVMNKLTPHV